MPAASSQKEPQLPAGFHQLLQVAHQHGHQGAIVQEAASYMPDIVSQYQGTTDVHPPQAFFNPQSPPLINLSPNLSSSSDLSQRSSPVYDLRESTRRRTIQGSNFYYFSQELHRLVENGLNMLKVNLS